MPREAAPDGDEYTIDIDRDESDQCETPRQLIESEKAIQALRLFNKWRAREFVGKRPENFYEYTADDVINSPRIFARMRAFVMDELIVRARIEDACTIDQYLQDMETAVHFRYKNLKRSHSQYAEECLDIPFDSCKEEGADYRYPVAGEEDSE